MTHDEHVQRLLAITLSVILVISVTVPAYAQLSTETDPSPGPGATAKVIMNPNKECTVIDFEGVGNNAPVGTIGLATFSANALGLIDSDAGGSGNFANEPSASTIMYSPLTPIIVMTLSEPVSEISWNYVSPSAGTVRVYDASDSLLATIPLPAIPQVNPGDPNGGGFGTWAPGSQDEGTNIIKRVEFDGVPNFIGWDDIDFCIFHGVVAGELLPIDNTALFVAGIQSSAFWMFPTLAGLAGAGFFIVKTRWNKTEDN